MRSAALLTPSSRNRSAALAQFGGAVSGKVTEFKESVAAAEKASANFVHDDPNVGVDNITQEGSDVKVGHAFKDDQVAVDSKKVSTAGLERSLRDALGHCAIRARRARCRRVARLVR